MRDKVLKSLGGPVYVSRVRKQRCCTDGCQEKSRLAVVMPLSDIEPQEDGTLGPGLGAVVLCAQHVEEVVVRLSRWV